MEPKAGRGSARPVEQPPFVHPTPRPTAPAPPTDALRGMTTRALVNELATKASQLVRKEIELAKIEVRADVRAQIKADPGLATGSVPVDMVTTSGSGLDPDITVANARAQAARVAQARGMSRAAVLRLVGEHTTGRTLGFIGEPRVNVLALNLALDRSAASTQAGL